MPVSMKLAQEAFSSKTPYSNASDVNRCRYSFSFVDLTGYAGTSLFNPPLPVYLAGKEDWEAKRHSFSLPILASCGASPISVKLFDKSHAVVYITSIVLFMILSPYLWR